MANKKINVQDIAVRISEEGYICITDIAKKFNSVPSDIIKNWMRNRNTVEFLGTWEIVHNDDFNLVGFDQIRMMTGTSTFILTVSQWINEANAVGLTAKAGRYGGTYAHQDIALEFCSYVSPQFKIYFIQEFKRLKEKEAKTLNTAWDVRRELAKMNYSLLTNTIAEKIPDQVLGTKKAAPYFSSEADLINMAVFGKTAQQWKRENPKKKGNQRAHASGLELLILSNLEAINTYLIKWDTDQDQRLTLLTEIAEHQREVLPESQAAKRLIDKANKKLE